jgi:non-specific serine/threonine protein kinase
VAISRRLDGLPLAIELAAARFGVLSVGQIAERLDDRYRLLTSGGRTALPRQQTLRAAMDWSHALLTGPERALLRRLAVFAGGFSLEAAEAVCGDKGQGMGDTGEEETRSRVPSRVRSEDVLDLLAQLVDKSLVIAERQDGAARYRLLETVRQYAREKLDDAEEGVAVRDRHRDWYLALAEAAEPELHGARVVEWLGRLEREHDNLRAALAWSVVEGRQPAEGALRLASAVTRFWELRGHAGEGRRWLTQLLAVDIAASPAVRARALCNAGVLAAVQGDFAAAGALYEESLTLCRELGDDDGIARAEANLGWLAQRRGDFAIARTLLEAGLVRGAAHRNKPVMATAQAILGQIALREGEFERARAYLEASLATQRELGNTYGIAGVLDDLATLAGEQGDDELQAAALAESLALFRQLGHKGGIALALSGYGMMAWLRGEHERGAALLEESLALHRGVGERAGIARLLGYQSVVALFGRDYARAGALSRECMTLYREAGDVWAIGRYLPVLAGVVFARGQAERAASLLAAAAALRERLGAPLPPAFQSSHDRTIAAVRRSLGEPAFVAAWAAGAAMPIEDALAEALSGDLPA